MIGIGTIVNTAAVIAGGGVGLILKRGINDRLQDTMIKTLGTATVFIGISGALVEMFALQDGKLTSSGTMLMVISLTIGAIVGELLQIEEKMEGLGETLKRIFHMQGEERFVDGFLTNALVICVGAMAIVGALQDGIKGDPSMLFAKAILDAMISAMFAAAMGIGVLFAAIPLFVYQMGITLLGTLISGYLSEAIISNMSFIGSVLIFLVGVNLLWGKQIRVGNLLPALLIPIIYGLLPWF